MATRTITTIPRKYFLPNNSVVSYQFPYWTNLLVNYFVCSTAIKAATKLHNKRVRWRVYGTQRRNAQSCGQNTAELSASVFPSAEDLQGMNSRDESYTVYTPRGWKKGDEHAREAWQINWESETTRGDTATETTLQSKFNYLPTPTLVSPFENPMQHGWMERYSWLKLIPAPLRIRKRMTIVWFEGNFEWFQRIVRACAK